MAKMAILAILAKNAIFNIKKLETPNRKGVDFWRA